MSNEKITLIVKATVNPDEKESFNAYIEQLVKLYANVNAESIGYFPVTETFVGTESPTFFAIYKFDSKDALSAVYDTDEYKSTMLPLRNKGFQKLEVYLS